MISCICPTYNRVTRDLLWLLEEAVHAFLLQDYPDKELVIINDTPGQELYCVEPSVRVLNVGTRFANLSDKITYGIYQAKGEFLTRWDDDDLHLPHALSLMRERLGDRMEWHASNYWFADGHNPLRAVNGPANTHVQAIWSRKLLPLIGGYPSGVSGVEDQQFNNKVIAANFSHTEELHWDLMYYIYRWGTGSWHLSGKANAGPNSHQVHYDEIGEKPVLPGLYEIRPHWKRHYLDLVREAVATS